MKVTPVSLTPPPFSCSFVTKFSSHYFACERCETMGNPGAQGRARRGNSSECVHMMHGLAGGLQEAEAGRCEPGAGAKSVNFAGQAWDQRFRRDRSLGGTEAPRKVYE